MVELVKWWTMVTFFLRNVLCGHCICVIEVNNSKLVLESTSVSVRSFKANNYSWKKSRILFHSQRLLSSFGLLWAWRHRWWPLWFIVLRSSLTFLVSLSVLCLSRSSVHSNHEALSYSPAKLLLGKEGFSNFSQFC